MTRKFFLKSLGLLAAGTAAGISGLAAAGKAIAAPLLQSGYPLRAGQRRFSIVHAISGIGTMTPDQLDRTLFESGLSEPFDLEAELAAMVEQGLLGQSVSTNGLVYRLTDTSGEALSGNRPDADALAEIDSRLEALREQFNAERDYIAQYTESSTGMVPVFLSIRQGALILLKINFVVDSVETAKVVTRNWMKNAGKTRRAVWENIGEGISFPTFQSIREVK